MIELRYFEPYVMPPAVPIVRLQFRVMKQIFDGRTPMLGRFDWSEWQDVPYVRGPQSQRTEEK